MNWLRGLPAVEHSAPPRKDIVLLFARDVLCAGGPSCDVEIGLRVVRMLRLCVDVEVDVDLDVDVEVDVEVELDVYI